jgi:hypothetical protein
MTTQRKLNSAPALRDPPNVARDGSPKLTQTAFEPAHPGQPLSGPQRTSLTPNFSNPLDDEREPKLKEGHMGRPAPIHPGTPSRGFDNRGGHVEGMAQAVLQNAADLGRPQSSNTKRPKAVIKDKANGRSYDGGSRPVTSRD